jgi:hypothetical protein
MKYANYRPAFSYNSLLGVDSTIRVLRRSLFLSSKLYVVDPADSIMRIVSRTCRNVKNGVFWDVTLCDSCENRRFGGT